MLEGKWNKIVGTARIMMVFRWLYEAFGSLAITSHEPVDIALGIKLQHYFCTTTSTLHVALAKWVIAPLLH